MKAEDRVGRRLRCEWCRQPFTQTNAMGPTPRYCKDTHRQMAHVQRVALKRAVAYLGEARMLRTGWVPRRSVAGPPTRVADRVRAYPS